MSDQKVPTVIILVGPSGSGKTTLMRNLCADDPRYRPALSVYSRAPRDGEVDGVDAHFVSRERFLEMVASGQIVEHVEFRGNFYGTVMPSLDDGAEFLVMVKEPVGAAALSKVLKEKGVPVVTAFVSCDEELLESRIRERMTASVAGLDPGNPSDAALIEGRQAPHLERLRALREERTEWIEPARSGEVPYSLFIDRYDGQNAKSVERAVKAVAGLASVLKAVGGRVCLAIAGPSGSGKTFFSMRAKATGFVSFIRSTTDRAMRALEVSGDVYDFVSPGEFDRLDAEGQFVERVEHDGKRYAVTASALEESFSQRTIPLLVATPDGIDQLKACASRFGYEVVSVFLGNTKKVLKERLFGERLQAELKSLDPSDPDYAAKVEKAKAIVEQRANTISKVEWGEWVEPAFSGDKLYTHVARTYGPENGLDVLADVFEALTQKILGQVPQLRSRQSASPGRR